MGPNGFLGPLPGLALRALPHHGRGARLGLCIKWGGHDGDQSPRSPGPPLAPLRPSAGATGPQAAGAGQSCPSNVSLLQARSSRTGRSGERGERMASGVLCQTLPPPPARASHCPVSDTLRSRSRGPRGLHLMTTCLGGGPSIPPP